MGGYDGKYDDLYKIYDDDNGQFIENSEPIHIKDGIIRLDKITAETKKIINDLCLEEKFDDEKWIKEFVIYINKYERILYSDVSAEIYSLDSDKVNVVLQNVVSMLQFENLKKTSIMNIYKLYDHINLANQQMNLVDASIDKIGASISGKIDETNKKSEALKSEFTEMVDKQADKINQVEKNYITILGIFASIIVAFTGGMAFNTSIFSNIHQVELHEIAFIALLVAEGFIHLVYLLLSSIYKIYKDSTLEYPKWLKCFNIFVLTLIAIVLILVVTRLFVY